jgi:hypothetical protein
MLTRINGQTCSAFCHCNSGIRTSHWPWRRESRLLACRVDLAAYPASPLRPVAWENLTSLNLVSADRAVEVIVVAIGVCGQAG